MDTYWKIIVLILMGLLLWLIVNRQSQDMGLLLTLAVCCAGMGAAVHYVSPVMDFLWQLNAIGNLQEDILANLIKAAGVGFVCETASSLCKDSGNSSLANLVHFLGAFMMLYISIPLLQKMLALIQEILGRV